MRHHRSICIAALVVTAAIAAACQGSGATTAPTAASSAAAQPTSAMMGGGTFHDIDGTATGEAQLIVAPDGAYEVVLEDFKIDSIEHTNLVLVSNADLTASSGVDPSKLLDLGPLKATSGMQDFPIPADMAGMVMQDYHTVVIWDTAMAHAIAAAPLQ
jgi:Electron transfer DM13